MRNNHDYGRHHNLRVCEGFALDAMKTLLAGNFTVLATMPPQLVIDAVATGRNVTMPAPVMGLTYLIYNKSSGAATLTIKDDAAATIGTIAQNKGAIVSCDGTNWYIALAGA